jgi:hypothetical protein
MARPQGQSWSIEDGEYLINPPSFYWNKLPVWNLDIAGNGTPVPNLISGGIPQYETEIRNATNYLDTLKNIVSKYGIYIIAIIGIMFYLKRK